MADSFDHLHLKRNTKGSSNELSFDVLDAARSGTQEDGGKNVRLARHYHGSYHGVMGASTLSGQEEVEQKKRRRHRRNAAIRAVMVSCIIVAVVAIGLFAYRFYVNAQSFDQQFNSIVERLVEQDEFLAELDASLTDPLDAVKEKKRQGLRDEIYARLESMSSIRDDAESAAAFAVGENERIAINQMTIAAESRLSMMGFGSQLLALSKTMNDEQSALNAIWNDVLDVDQQIRSATELSNKANTEQAIEESQEATQKALDATRAVCQELESAGETYSELDLSDQLEYMNTRAKSLEYALSTSAALIEGDREKAAAKNDLYNEYDKKAVSLAEKLPRSVSNVVKKAHSKNYKKLTGEYEKARAKTIEADTVVRNYMRS